ncbi:MAG: toll/interleukin-1 receptor domain-containing protein [Planctomycetaceae bacterium]
MAQFLEDREWKNLLRDVHHGQVLPVIGADLVTVVDPRSGATVSLQSFLAPRLAKALGLPEEQSWSSINRVACAYMENGHPRKHVYDELRELLEKYGDLQPNDALLKLASITDFDLFISGTFDRHLAHALAKLRPEFDPSESVWRFHPNRPIDIPDPVPSTAVYHIMGDFETYPDFAVWEEDYMEFICGLIENSDTMERLFRVLKSRYLLLLGAPSTDWIVRFFLRVARQTRLSDRRDGVSEYLADACENLEAPLIFFFNQMIPATRVIDGNPTEFVAELARQWHVRYGDCNSNDDFLSRLPDQMPKDSVFVSYAHEDRTQAVEIARALHKAGIPVWLDQARLAAGDNFETSLEAAVRVHAAFFISVVSSHTESNPNRYVHRERQWAATVHVDGFVFYVPIIISEEIQQPQLEPACFRNIHFERTVGRDVPLRFVHRVRELMREYRDSGRPRA